MSFKSGTTVPSLTHELSLGAKEGAHGPSRAQTLLSGGWCFEWSVFCGFESRLDLWFGISVDKFLAEVTPYCKSRLENPEPKFQDETCVEASVAARYSRRSSFLSKPLNPKPLNP